MLERLALLFCTLWLALQSVACGDDQFMEGGGDLPELPPAIVTGDPPADAPELPPVIVTADPPPDAPQLPPVVVTGDPPPDAPQLPPIIVTGSNPPNLPTGPDQPRPEQRVCVNRYSTCMKERHDSEVELCEAENYKGQLSMFNNSVPADCAAVSRDQSEQCDLFFRECMAGGRSVSGAPLP
jgi:hypothetical protein